MIKVEVEWRVVFFFPETSRYTIPPTNPAFSSPLWGLDIRPYFASDVYIPPMFICICLYYDCQECRYNGEVTHGWNSFFPQKNYFFFGFISFSLFFFCLSFRLDSLPEHRHISVLSGFKEKEKKKVLFLLCVSSPLWHFGSHALSLSSS